MIRGKREVSSLGKGTKAIKFLPYDGGKVLREGISHEKGGKVLREIPF